MENTHRGRERCREAWDWHFFVARATPDGPGRPVGSGPGKKIAGTVLGGTSRTPSWHILILEAVVGQGVTQRGRASRVHPLQE